MKYSKLQTEDILDEGLSPNLQKSQQKTRYGRGNSTKTASSATNLSAGSLRRGHRKHSTWGSRERTGMSFLIVIAFFAVFGLIILTEIFMIDERTSGGILVRGGGGYGNHLSDSMPDYENVKDDYDLLDSSILNNNKFGFVQFQENKLKIQDDRINEGRVSGVLVNSISSVNTYTGAGVGGGTGMGASSIFSIGNGPLIPWGRALPNKIEETLPTYPAEMKPGDGYWQMVNGTRFKFFVFSAFYDRRDGAKLIRVIGATKTRGPERVWCRLWYPVQNLTLSSTKNHYNSITIVARVKVIRENWNLKYSACFVLCPLHSSDYGVPESLSIVARLKSIPGNLLMLRNTDSDPDFQQNFSIPKNGNNSMKHLIKSNKYKSLSNGQSKLPNEQQIAEKLAVCVKPFHFSYDQALYLLEYLEFYTLLGVSHFTFYNHTIGPHVDCILQHYIKGDIPNKSTMLDAESPVSQLHIPQFQDINQSNVTTGNFSKPLRWRRSHYIKPTIEILPWNLRMRSQKEIRTEGLFAALNDCLYRTMYRYKYLALVDLDEFIVPRHNDTLIELLRSMNERFRNRNIGTYSFQNAFFYLQFVDDPLILSTAGSQSEISDLARLRSSLITQKKTRRRFKLHPQKQRSKYICKPEAIVEAGNHFVWEFLPGKGSLNVPPTDAILQHYRVCEFGGNDCIKTPSIIDRTTTKYVNRLVERVYQVYKHLKRTCELPDLLPMPTSETMTLSTFKPLATENSKLESSSKKQHKFLHNSIVLGKQKNVINFTSKLEIEKQKPMRNVSLFSTVSSNTFAKKIAISNTKSTAKTLTSEVISKSGMSLELKNNQKTHKVVVFFVDNQGQAKARLEYH